MGENSHSCKVKSKPSRSSTLKQPKQVKLSRSKKPVIPPYKFKPLNLHFHKITHIASDVNSDQELAGLVESEENKPEYDHLNLVNFGSKNC